MNRVDEWLAWLDWLADDESDPAVIVVVEEQYGVKW
ncbi:hypothetical protein SEA_DIANE_37 [Streptomyces phage Diane]|uniref:Uncharacterized protein n=1 Tax=Streptomyces phage Diane TaxID=2041207 RepID=A0A291LHK0_9CAUD|nr:hypothetical protein KGG78_gp37 [Streptomyces phage Diane]ATI18821.1 hypothetical protein SEA_DIANE_37 [Streptomyces phage Diane]